MIYASGISEVNYSLTLDRQVAAIASGSGIEVDIVLVDDRGVRIRYR